MSIRVKLVGPERCDVAGVVGVVKPGDVIELEDEKAIETLPRAKAWWKKVEGKGTAERPKEVKDDTSRTG